MKSSAAQVQNKKQRTLLAIASLLIIVLAALVVFFFLQYSNAKKDSDASSKEETSIRIIKQVGDLYILPKGEEPTVAEIKDKEKLKGQAFFEDAQNGDYVLIYSKDKIALLYRESENKLVNVGPVNTGEDVSTPEAPATE